jgi:SAM-dependent methyltransferase
MPTVEAEVYSADFYALVTATAARSAREIVPLVLEYVRPASVVDIGCGQGVWLATFARHGVSAVCGVDGAWVDRASLCIPAAQFQVVNLNEPIALGRTFDLVVSLEVGEHLPPESADTFVASLTSHGPLVLFSAAIPGQPGVRHVNEQWPAYWAERFLKHGFVAVDCLRPRLWQNRNVDWWYAQNCLFFVRADCVEDYPPLRRPLAERASAYPLALVHPELYRYRSAEAALRPGYMRLGAVARALPWLVQYELRQRPGYVRVRRAVGAVWQATRRALGRQSALPSS